MTVGQAVLLGLIQGLTEFLPVSSSGHLVLGRTLLGIPEQGIAFEVFVHFGTLLAVVTAFHRDLLELMSAAVRPMTRRMSLRENYRADYAFRQVIYLILATLPAALIGLVFESALEEAFSNPRLVCVMLIVTSLILLATLRTPKAGRKLNLLNTLLVGVAQSLAILPGISRSGSTISAGLFLRLSGEDAARFSFLLALPAILGATALKTADLMASEISRQQFITLATGTLTAYLSGYLAIEWLLGIVRRGRLYAFSPYCFLVGIIGLVLLS